MKIHFLTNTGCRLAIACALIAAAGAQTKIDLRTQTKSVDFSGATSTKPSKTGTGMPSTCAVGETFLKTDAQAGQNLYVCTATNVWTPQAGAAPSVTGFANTVLATDGTSLLWRALGGDITGAPNALTVGKLQGRTIASTAPANGQVLTWNTSTNQWEPKTGTGGGNAAGGGSYSGQVSPRRPR